MNTIARLGWDDSFESAWTALAKENLQPGRVIADYGASYKIAVPTELRAAISGRMEYLLEPHEMPKVGDWVTAHALDDGQGIIHDVLPRRSEIGRKQPGERVAKQVLAANVDIAFLVQALDHDFSPERLQRYLFQL